MSAPTGRRASRSTSGRSRCCWRRARPSRCRCGRWRSRARAPAANVEEKLRIAFEYVVEDANEARWIEAHLAPLAGLTHGRELRGDRRTEAFAAWRRFLELIAARRPLVLVFEDIHWADDG